MHRLVAWITGLSVSLAVSGALAQDLRPQPRPDPGGEDEPVVMSSKSPAPRPGDLLQGFAMRLALSAAKRGDWDAAGSLARSESAVAADIIEWQRLRAGKGSFPEYRVFLERNGDWPGLKLLRRRGEAAIPEGSAAVHIIGYFEREKPQTGYGALQLARALLATERKAEAEAELVRAWTELEMSAGDEAAILEAFPKVVAPHHNARLDLALWEEDIAGAKRMLPRVDAGWKALAAARLGLQRRAKNVDGLIKAVPEVLANDPGLAHDRMDWAIAKKRRDQAGDIIIEASPGKLGRPEYWANWRRILARQAMRDGKPARAYRLASRHGLRDGSDFADLEWLSGYLALRYLDKPDDALTHFRNFRIAVYTPISLGRAGYWEGRAHEAMGQDAAARAAYAEAAEFQTSFYGLLAAEKIGAEMDPALTGRLGISPWRNMEFAQSSVYVAAGLFQEAGQSWETSRFLRHLAETTAEPELVGLADYALSLGDPYLAVRVAKQVAREGVVAHRAYYPLARLGRSDLPVEEALALSIARRESEFHAEAISGAGARGLMQLMPATARQMAEAEGVDYSKARLTSDPAYNARLGSAYLAYLIEEFGNNIVLVSVGYNAGPHRSKRWMEDRGDPRNASVDVVDWIEHIPFRETRNYVMRVAESLPIYRARLTGKLEPIRLSEELKAR